MKHSLKKIPIVALAIIGFGLLKFPIEKNLTSELKNKNLLEKGLDSQTKEKIGQTSGVVALGGLRSVVAAMLNIRAHIFFENQEWYKQRETFGLITALQPRSNFYWENGGWHMAYNASIDFLNRTDLPEPRRRLLWREFIYAGSDFLEQGARLNPEKWKIKAQLMRLWSDPNKIEDIPRAVTYLKDFKDQEDVLTFYKRNYFYLLARIPGREMEAYEEGRKLFDAVEDNKLPTLVCLMFTLQNRLGSKISNPIPFKEIFENATDAKILQTLEDFSKRKETYPMDGVEEKMKSLRTVLGPQI